MAAAVLECGAVWGGRRAQGASSGIPRRELYANKMLRRNQRLRKEYLYRKGLEGKERAEYERKRQMKRALEGERGGAMHRRRY